MKAFRHLTLSALAACAWLSPFQVAAEPGKVIVGPLSTGSVVVVDPAHGTMIVQSAQSGGPITFYGMEKARIETSAGRLTTFADVRLQMAVTVQYTPIDGKWYVGKVIIPEPQVAPPATPATSLTSAEEKALNSKAANDGDITTKPGVKARIDNDITTQPGKKDPRDSDITKKTDK